MEWSWIREMVSLKLEVLGNGMTSSYSYRLAFPKWNLMILEYQISHSETKKKSY